MFHRVALGICSWSFYSTMPVGETSLIISYWFFLVYLLELVGSFTEKQPVWYISLEILFPEQSSLKCRSLCIGEDFFPLDWRNKNFRQIFASLVQTATETLQCKYRQLLDCLQCTFCASVAAPVSCVGGLLLWQCILVCLCKTKKLLLPLSHQHHRKKLSYNGFQV